MKLVDCAAPTEPVEPSGRATEIKGRTWTTYYAPESDTLYECGVAPGQPDRWMRIIEEDE